MHRVQMIMLLMMMMTGRRAAAPRLPLTPPDFDIIFFVSRVRVRTICAFGFVWSIDAESRFGRVE